MRGKTIIPAIVFATFAAAQSLSAQEITLTEADTIFAQRNLRALAAKCDISIADANVSQARLRPNPVVAVEENVRNRINGRWLDFGRQSEQTVSADQLISIAGQHANALRVAQLGGQAARAAFADLLRTLSGEMRQTFVELCFAQRDSRVYKNEIMSLQNVLGSLVTQERKGNISRIETARIRALLLSLRQEQEQCLANEAQLQSRLHTFLAMPDSSRLVAVMDVGSLDNSPLAANGIEELGTYAGLRSDVELAKANQAVAEAQIKAERSKAWPEIHVTGSYDRNGGYFKDYFGIGISMSLPIFNRNQGRIRAAKEAAAQSQYETEEALNRAGNEVYAAADNYRRASALLASVSKDFDRDDIESLFKGVNENYRKRNISLLEFCDFYKTYKDAMLQMSQIRRNVFIAAEKLNIAAGKTIVQYE